METNDTGKNVILQRELLGKSGCPLSALLTKLLEQKPNNWERVASQWIASFVSCEDDMPFLRMALQTISHEVLSSGLRKAKPKLNPHKLGVLKGVPELTTPTPVTQFPHFDNHATMHILRINL
jgi:hypothetical protein